MSGINGAESGNQARTRIVNLQHLTSAQAARLMNVSERQVYAAKELMRSGRDDLCNQVMAGGLSLHAALKLAKPNKYCRPRDPYSDLMKAFNKAPEEARQLFVFRLLKEAGQ